MWFGVVKRTMSSSGILFSFPSAATNTAVFAPQLLVEFRTLGRQDKGFILQLLFALL